MKNSLKSRVESSQMNNSSVIVIWGPSGVGKSTLIKRLLSDFPDNFAFGISHTSRTLRPGETEGVEYHFVAKDEFERLLKQSGFFIESTEFSGNYYGTSIQAVKDIIKSGGGGRVCILDLDLKGVQSVYELPDLRNALFVRILPSNIGLLRKRLKSRGDTSYDQIEKRLKIAEEDLFKSNEIWRRPNHITFVSEDDDDRETVYEKFKNVIGMNGV